VPATVDDLLGSARSRIRRLGPQEANAAWQRGALLIDIRPAAQRRREGEIPGALIIERNVLEWRLDPESDHRLAEITDHGHELIIVCSEGYASSFAAATLVDLGFASAADLDGGFRAWEAAGLPVASSPDERVTPPPGSPPRGGTGAD
jgi:rhodanese-related sulfurtransferase